jgi:uncharacterized protein (TIGR02145 family)
LNKYRFFSYAINELLKWRCEMKINKTYLIGLVLFCTGLTGLKPQTVKDADGNNFKTIDIGNQTWMAANLKTTKFNDGSDIPVVTNDKSWYGLTTPAYCWFNNDSSSNKAAYGALYNWFAVSSGKLCPEGWHVPSDEEWTALTTYLGGESIAGSKLKEAGTTHWKNTTRETSNETGFSALPGGFRNLYGKFSNIRSYGTWWSRASQEGQRYAWARTMNKTNQAYRAYFYMKSGFSVRCLKDK